MYKAMRLKDQSVGVAAAQLGQGGKGQVSGRGEATAGRGGAREVSERRQVGDAESLLSRDVGGSTGGRPWWRDVGMEEGM